MAQLPRKLQRVFADVAGTDEVGQIGSRAGGAPTTSKDLDVIQGNARFLQGWFNTSIQQTLTGGVEADLPASEDFNGMFLMLTSQLLYYFQNGFPEWLDDANERYYANRSFVQVNGDVYVALRGDDAGDVNSQQNPATSPDYWRLIWSQSATAFYRNLVGPTTIVLSDGTPPRFIEVTGGTPFTLMLNGFIRPSGSPLTIYNNTTETLTIAGSSGITGDIPAGGFRHAVSTDSEMLANSGFSELTADNIETTGLTLLNPVSGTFDTVNLTDTISVVTVPLPAGIYYLHQAASTGDTIAFAQVNNRPVEGNTNSGSSAGIRSNFETFIISDGSATSNIEYRLLSGVSGSFQVGFTRFSP